MSFRKIVSNNGELFDAVLPASGSDFVRVMGVMAKPKKEKLYDVIPEGVAISKEASEYIGDVTNITHNSTGQCYEITIDKNSTNTGAFWVFIGGRVYPITWGTATTFTCDDDDLYHELSLIEFADSEFQDMGTPTVWHTANSSTPPTITYTTNFDTKSLRKISEKEFKALPYKVYGGRKKKKWWEGGGTKPKTKVTDWVGLFNSTGVNCSCSGNTFAFTVNIGLAVKQADNVSSWLPGEVSFDIYDKNGLKQYGITLKTNVVGMAFHGIPSYKIDPGHADVQDITDFTGIPKKAMFFRLSIPISIKLCFDSSKDIIIKNFKVKRADNATNISYMGSFAVASPKGESYDDISTARTMGMYGRHAGAEHSIPSGKSAPILIPSAIISNASRYTLYDSANNTEGQFVTTAGAGGKIAFNFKNCLFDEKDNSTHDSMYKQPESTPDSMKSVFFKAKTRKTRRIAGDEAIVIDSYYTLNENVPGSGNPLYLMDDDAGGFYQATAYTLSGDIDEDDDAVEQDGSRSNNEEEFFYIDHEKMAGTISEGQWTGVNRGVDDTLARKHRKDATILVVGKEINKNSCLAYDEFPRTSDPSVNYSGKYVPVLKLPLCQRNEDTGISEEYKRFYVGSVTWK